VRVAILPLFQIEGETCHHSGGAEAAMRSSELQESESLRDV